MKNTDKIIKILVKHRRLSPMAIREGIGEEIAKEINSLYQSEVSINKLSPAEWWEDNEEPLNGGLLAKDLDGDTALIDWNFLWTIMEDYANDVNTPTTSIESEQGEEGYKINTDRPKKINVRSTSIGGRVIQSTDQSKSTNK